MRLLVVSVSLLWLLRESYASQSTDSVGRLIEFLRINSGHPKPTYDGCISWIQNQANELGLTCNLTYFEPPDSFALWLTWEGTNRSLPSILINTHMDVVAVAEEKWSSPPFEAKIDNVTGNIIARGAIDMKSATVGALEAIRRLKNDGFSPLRSIHLTVMPDEEVGGHLGMEPFVNSPLFAQLNVGVDIDECEINPGDQLLISYAEKAIWQFNVTAKGIAAHASTLPAYNETASGQLLSAIGLLMNYREQQYQLVEQDSDIDVSDVTSINLVRMGGGIGNNIIPDELWASFDMRIRIKSNWTFPDVEAFLNSIIASAGRNVTLSFIQKSEHAAETSIDDGNPWWAAILETCSELNVTCGPQVISGATDGRYVRSKGIPVYGINPILNTPKLQHQTDEALHPDNFLDGIERWKAFIKNLASLP